MKTLKKNELQYVALGLVALAASLSSVSAFAGNGEGHNGPTLSPISVPGVDERGVDERVVQAARATCLVMGAPDRGIKSVLRRAGEKVFGYRFADWGDFKDKQGPWAAVARAAGSETEGLSLQLSVKVPFPPGFLYGLYDLDSVVFESKTGIFQLSEYRNSYTTRQQRLKNSVMNLEFPDGVGFPEIHWQDRVKVSDYDQFEEPYNTRYYLKGLTIDQVESVVPVALINKESGKETALTIDLAGYADCLISEIQRGAH